MSWAAKLVLLLAIFAAGGASGIKWQLGVQARADVLAAELRASDARQQRITGDLAATGHATRLAAVNQQLGDQRAKIAKLSGRECLGAGTVSMLNGTATGKPVPATTGEPDGAPAAVAADSDERYATDADAADAIAICRAGYAGLASQVNAILDIEGARLTRARP